jgi:hypothetical protein
VLISHGYCATFGIEVPAPFYMQSLVAEIYPDPNYFVHRDGDSRLNALQSLINSAEETTPDSHSWAEWMTDMKTCWWNDKEGDVASLPDFFELDALFFKKINQVCFQPFPYNSLNTGIQLEEGKHINLDVELNEDAVEHILSLNFTRPIISKNKSTDTPDVPMAPPTTDNQPFGPPNRYLHPLDERSTRFIKQATQPRQGLLSNTKLLKLRDQITSIEQRLRMLQSQEREIVERRSYNIDLCIGLDQLSKRLDEIPFRDTQPSCQPLSGTSHKGKEHEVMKPASMLGVEITSDHAPNFERMREPTPPVDMRPDTLSDDTFEGGWASRVIHGMDADDGAIPVPLGPMTMPEWVERFDDLFAKVLPAMFGPQTDDHQCSYRLLLTKLLRDEFQQLSIEDAIGKSHSVATVLVLTCVSGIART